MSHDLIEEILDAAPGGAVESTLDELLDHLDVLQVVEQARRSLTGEE